MRYLASMNRRTHERRCLTRDLRGSVLRRDGHACRMCGQTVGDPDPCNGRPVQVGVGLIVPVAHGGTMVPDNLRTLCSTCRRGLKMLRYRNRPCFRELKQFAARLRSSDLQRVLVLLSWSLHGAAAPIVSDQYRVSPLAVHEARVAHIKDKSLGGRDELSNLRALCSTCNQGAKNITAEKASTIWLLSQIRRAGLDEQRACYEWLRSKFERK